ncbi:MAG: copper amine oxidase N-terminal domain-containing protein [Candidatus Pristimantibacillus sp.]
MKFSKLTGCIIGTTLFFNLWGTALAAKIPIIDSEKDGIKTNPTIHVNDTPLMGDKGHTDEILDPRGVGIIIDGIPLMIDKKEERPFIDETGRTMIPVRFVSEKLGTEVTWSADEKKITIKDLSNTDSPLITLKIDSQTIEVGNDFVQMDTTAQLIGERTFVPLRFVSEALGANVIWFDSSRTASIIKAKKDISN